MLRLRTVKKVGLMNPEKQREAVNFLRQLNDPYISSLLLSDRVDSDLMDVIYKYAEQITSKKGKMALSETELYTSSMIIGYLLKGHMDRYELNRQIYNN
jgi:hypothetical protein